MQDFNEALQQYSVRAASLAKLVEQLTRRDRSDTEYKLAFLLTLRSFCTPRQLLDLLMRRFHVPQPVGTSPEELAR